MPYLFPPTFRLKSFQMFQVMLNQKQIKQNEKKKKKNNNKKFPPQKHNKKKKKPTRLITALKCNGIEHGF